jgi:hypothetical protein
MTDLIPTICDFAGVQTPSEEWLAEARRNFGDPIDFKAVNARRSQPGDAQTAYE